ncbi:MAG: metallophosphoesterase [Candidatus Moranbacteria bacterium]|nr:metallophosphoesterase [Candidatus Moranbacteria bacterium]
MVSYHKRLAKQFRVMMTAVFFLVAVFLLAGCQPNDSQIGSYTPSLSMKDLKSFGEKFYQSISFGKKEIKNEEPAIKVTPIEAKTEKAPVDESVDNSASGENNDATGETAQSQAGQENQNKQDEQSTPSENPSRTADLIIGIMADAHSSPEKGFGSIFTFGQRMKATKPDFVVQLGDFIESRIGYAPKKREPALADFRKANANLEYTPKYHVIGNHEMLSFNKKDFENLTGRNNYNSSVVNGYQIIILDSMYECDGGKIESDDDKPGAYMGCLPEVELDWLAKKIKSSDRNIIFVHHPLYSIRGKEGVLEILEKYKDKILLIVSGHKHRARKSKLEGITYIDTPSLNFQRQYVIVEINGEKPSVSFRNLY